MKVAASHLDAKGALSVTIRRKGMRKPVYLMSWRVEGWEHPFALRQVKDTVLYIAFLLFCIDLILRTDAI